jgi:hypothetical protein
MSAIEAGSQLEYTPAPIKRHEQIGGETGAMAARQSYDVVYDIHHE